MFAKSDSRRTDSRASKARRSAEGRQISSIPATGFAQGSRIPAISASLHREKQSSQVGTERTRTIAQGVVRVLYRFTDRESSGSSVPYQVAFAVPKRVRKAVDRNRLKRLLRVAFQQIKPAFDALRIPEDQFLSFMILFRGDGRSVEKQVVIDSMRAFESLIRQVKSNFEPSGSAVDLSTKQS